jgi:inhibitor of cysteine peptidase
MMVKNMKSTKWFIFTFLATLLVISSIPLSLYLTAPETPVTPEPNEPTEPTGPTEPNEIAIELNKFASIEELKTYLETTPQGSYYALDSRGAGLESNDALLPPQSPEAAPEPSETESSDYSKTNIQVEGVDEADIVKTDGEYIYIVSGNNLTIVKAYPPEEARVVSKISFDGGVMGIFINGDKLAIFVNDYSVYLLYEGVKGTDSAVTVEPAAVNEVTEDEGRVPEPTNATTPEAPVTEPSDSSIPSDDSVQPVEPIIWEPPTTSIKVYDISDRANPVLTRDFAIDGNYFNSRMIGDYVYVVAIMYTFYTETAVALPRIHSDNTTDVIPATDIYYSNFSDTSYTFTTIIALNINDDAQQATHETMVLGGTSAIYVSQKNIYLNFPDYSWQEDETMKTTIYKAKIDKESITFVATGEVPGYILNQFSMDEHGGYFRIATTVNNFNWRTFDEEATSKNNVYVLDMSLNIVGKLEDLAPGEQIYSTRFMGDRCYMVTFRNIDPLFVIDLSDATAPTVLGELKVTGYSGYLHPYDENHIIGIGKETSYDAKEDFAWYQGIKISLFDVSDVSNPIEVAKYEIGDRGTDSPILYDHKSLLFDREKNLLVIPVLVAEIDESDYTGDVPDNAYGEYVWQGAYVLDISLDGIELRGRITHIDDNGLFNDVYYRYYGYYDYTLQRSLYIENVLYTISSMKVKINNLETLAEINTVELS